MSNKELIEQLAEKAELSNKEVEEQLQRLKEYLSSELQKSQTCTLEGLGTFSVNNGEIKFSPEQQLALEINHTYAGMKPIELIGAYKEMSDIVESDVENQEEVSAATPIDSGVEKYEEPITADEEPKKAQDSGTQIEESEVEEPELESSKEAETEPPAPVEAEVEQSQPEEEPVPEPTPPAGSDISKTKPKVEPKSKPKEKTKKEAGDPIGKWLVAAVIVIALGLGGWLVYDMGLSGNGNQEGVSQASTGQPVAQAGQGTQDVEAGNGSSQTPDAGANDGSDMEGKDANEETPASEQDNQNSISEDTRIAEESRQSIYGLRGGATPEVSDGYTIVVHSLRDEAKVRRVNNELQQQGYRTIVYSANVMDTTFWRLGLGQFKTVDDALEAASTLPEVYRDNHFIKRIQ